MLCDWLLWPCGLFLLVLLGWVSLLIIELLVIVIVGVLSDCVGFYCCLLGFLWFCVWFAFIVDCLGELFGV